MKGIKVVTQYTYFLHNLYASAPTIEAVRKVKKVQAAEVVGDILKVTAMAPVRAAILAAIEATTER